jgi:Tat protein translocase TatB subunit
MLGIGMQEILIILVVALIVIGPKRLPELAKTLGRGFAEFKKAADDLQDTVRMDLQREKHEELRQKHSAIDIPETEDEEKQREEEERVKAQYAGNVDAIIETPEEAQAEADKPAEEEPSYNPDEIEGGDEMEDDGKDA